MSKRFRHYGLFAVLWIAVLSTVSLGSERRNTPTVRAVERAKVAIVNIHSEKTATDNDALFGSAKGRKVNGMGTGIIIDDRGYIVTNYHVIADVDTLRVTLCDGSIYDAQTISYDRQHDLAVIKVNATRPLPVGPLGTSSDLMLAETVIAVGNAFGYEHTVTVGIVSALGRDVSVNKTQSYYNLIQTDASINPGNSGGPLINLDGEIIGINVAIRAGAQRIGFAIPIDDARTVVAKLLSTEKLNQTQHGLVAHDVKNGATRMLVVDQALPGGPAVEAGFQPGDVITGIGDIAIVDGADLERALLGHKAGESIDVEIRRNDAAQSLELTLVPFRANPQLVADSTTVIANDPVADAFGDRVWKILGVKLQKVADNTNPFTGTRYRGGFQVADVRDNGPAAINGIQRGDILVGLHVWETVKYEDVSYVLEHPKLETFNPLKFFILRDRVFPNGQHERETLYGHLSVTRDHYPASATR